MLADQRSLHPQRYSYLSFLFYAIIPRPPPSTLFPYTTLFRSIVEAAVVLLRKHSADLVPDFHFLFEHGHLDEKMEVWRSEEHTSELQSPYDLVCRLLLEKKKVYPATYYYVTYVTRLKYHQSTT